MPEHKISAGQTILHDQKLAAWAFVVGERPGRAESGFGRRPHRGMLPDVDFDRAIADSGRRPLLSRIAGFLFGGRHRSAAQTDAQAELRAALAAVLGERLADAYIGEDAYIAEDESGEDKSRGAAIRPSQPATKDWSRAA